MKKNVPCPTRIFQSTFYIDDLCVSVSHMDLCVRKFFHTYPLAPTRKLCLVRKADRERYWTLGVWAGDKRQSLQNLFSVCGL